MKKLTDRFFYLAAGIITLLIILGLVLIWFMVRDQQKSIADIEDRQLMEYAEVADSNLSRVLRRLRYSVQNFMDTDPVRTAEEKYREDRDAEAFSAFVSGTDLMNNEWVSGVRVLYDGTEMFVYNASPDGQELPDCQDAMSDPVSIIASPDGQGYLFYQRDSSRQFRYDVYFSLSRTLSEIGEPAATLDSPESMIFLYDGVFGIYAGSRSEKIRIAEVADDPSMNSDILALVMGIETQGTTDTWNLLLTDDQQVTHRLGGAVISSQKSENRRFAVGLITDFTERTETDVKNMKTMISVMLLAVLGLICMFLLFLLFYKRAQAKEKKIREMNELNQKAEQRFLDSQVLEQRDRLETIGVLSSSLAHEFNNLLTPIMGYSAMSMSMVPDTEEELLENLSSIYSASLRAKTLVSRMSVYSKRNDGSTFRLLSPDMLIGEVGTLLSPSVPPFVKVDQQLNCPEPCILGDRIQLIQLFVNLCVNAFQAMKEEGGTLTIRTERGDGFVRVSFRDTGKGIPPDELAVIFEPFFTTKGEGGTGLGLPIAKRIAEVHGADLLVDSEPGRGTVFTVVFPNKEA